MVDPSLKYVGIAVKNPRLPLGGGDVMGAGSPTGPHDKFGAAS